VGRRPTWRSRWGLDEEEEDFLDLVLGEGSDASIAGGSDFRRVLMLVVRVVWNIAGLVRLLIADVFQLSNGKQK